MTRFIGGPANGQLMAINRTPPFLRVVRGSGKWDALDQLDDVPRPGEEVFVYRRDDSTPQATVHVDYVENGKRKSRNLRIATYRYYRIQPSQQEAHDTEHWRNWCNIAQSQEGTPQ